jgi:fumarate reductase subunit D
VRGTNYKLAFYLMQILAWLVTSSNDPEKYSATVKGALGLVLAWFLQISPLVCGAHIVCIDSTVLQSAVQTTGNIVYFALSLISGVVFLFGLCRKVWLGRFSAYIPPEVPNV